MHELAVDISRTLYVTGLVDVAMTAAVIPQLERLDAGEGPIRIVINSEGGDEQCGYAIYDAIRNCRNPVVIVGYGSVMSIAAAIFQAGDYRYLAPNTLFMIHNGNMGEDMGDNPSQDSVVAWADHLKKHNKRYYQILSGGSQQGMDVIEAWCTDETYFTAKEAANAGFADEILEPRKSYAPMKRRKERRK
jgi:ATP-dependent Clp protease protease subunit